MGLALALASVAINGLPILWGAVAGVLRQRMNEAVPVPGVDARDVLTLAACVEQHSTHPMAFVAEE